MESNITRKEFAYNIKYENRLTVFILHHKGLRFQSTDLKWEKGAI